MFKSLHNRAPLNEAAEQPNFSIWSESKADQSSNWSRHVTLSKIIEKRIIFDLNLVFASGKQKKMDRLNL